MPSAWPTTLPQYELSDATTMTMPDPAVRVVMADGTMKAARVTSAAPRNYLLAYRMTAEQYSIFRGWLAAVLAGDQMWTKSILGEPLTLLISGPVSVTAIQGGLHYHVIMAAQEVL